MPNFRHAVFSFNPTFTQDELDRFARAKHMHAAYLFDCAAASLACVADGGALTLKATNLDILAHATKTLSLLYRAACADERVDDRVIGAKLDDLFWPILGAAARYLECSDPDCLVEWEWWLECAARLTKVLVDIANSGHAKGRALEDIIADLETLAFAAAVLHDWLEKLIASFDPADVEDLSIARDSDRLTAYLFDAVKQLKSRRPPDVETRAAA